MDENTTVVENEVEEIVDPRQECAKEVDAVLKKYNMTLVPTLQLMEVPAMTEGDAVEESVEEVKETD